MVESPYMHDGVKMARENPRKALELELEHAAFRKGQEAGADAMLGAISEEIEKALLTDEDIRQANKEAHGDIPCLIEPQPEDYIIAQVQHQKILSLLKE